MSRSRRGIDDELNRDAFVTRPEPDLRRAGAGHTSGGDSRSQHVCSNGGPVSHSEPARTVDFRAALAREIDAAAADRPTLTKFLQRLERRGISAVPSIQSSGRWNGMSYRWGGQFVKGSDVGRGYTAKGLQQHGVQYDPDRDREALARALDRASIGEARAQSHNRTDVRSECDRTSQTRIRETGLNRDQEATVTEIGRFRTLAADDVRRYGYGGNDAAFTRDLRVLRERNLVQIRTVADPRRRSRSRVLVLTPKGRSVAGNIDQSSRDGGPRQRYYSGFVKPAEVRHDVAIYRMYQAERERIERTGGSVKRVVLDYELKREVYSRLNRNADGNWAEESRRKQQIAEQSGLAVVQGKVVFPDLRIEYESDAGEVSRVDLEFASDQYKTSEVMQKRAAGLRIYAPDSTPRSPALQDPGIVAGLISI